MKRNWTHLSTGTRAHCSNLAKLRFGTVALALFIITTIIFSAATKGPTEFLEAIFSFTFLAAILAALLCLFVLTKRASQIAPIVVDEMMEILPQDAVLIQEIYGTRGAGDIFAPWIRTPAGFFMRLMKGLGARFNPFPKL